MKKLLLGLMATTVLGSAAMSVISCGPDIMGRTQPTDTYKATFKANMTSWSSGFTMQQDDSIILAQLQDSLLAGDQHGNYQGDLADTWAHNSDSTTWTFHVRDGVDDTLYWSDSQGNKKGTITAKDFFNTFRYVLNPANSSDTLSAWTSIVKDGENLYSFLTDLKTKGKSNYDPNCDSSSSSSEDGNAAHNFAAYNLDRYILAYNIAVGEGKTGDDAIEETKDLLNSNKYKDDINADPATRITNYNRLINDSMANGGIIKVDLKNGITNGDNAGYNLEINTEKTCPYFEGLAAFLSYAPLPDYSVDYFTGASGINYGSVSNGNGYDTIWYSGAYIVDKYLASQQIVLRENPNYFNKQNVFVKKQIYSYIATADVSKPRTLFESGDISEVVLSPTDSSGWNKYVGDDYQNPKFNGANVIDKKNGITWDLMYNFAYSKDGSSLDSSHLAASEALAQNAVRQYIAYNLDRSYIAKYYSAALDTGHTSSLIRNIYTSKNTAVTSTTYTENGSIDYTDLVQNNYYNSNESGESESVIEEIKEALTNDGANFDFSSINENYLSLADGNDAYLNNDLIGAQAFFDIDANGNYSLDTSDQTAFNKFVNYIGDYTDDGLKAKEEALNTRVKDVLKAKTGQEHVTIEWMTNGAQATTLNLKINDAIEHFDVTTSGGPISIEQDATTDADEYKARQNSGQFSMMVSGWSADYSDPYNFLGTMSYGGDYNSIIGYSRLFDGYNEDGSSLKLKDGISDAFSELATQVATFSKMASKANGVTTSGDDRLEALAAAENYGFVKSALNLSLYAPNLDETPALTYVDVLTRSTMVAGQAQYRMVGVKMLSQIETQSEYLKRRSEWEKEVQEGGTYKAIYPNGFNGSDEYYAGYND